MWKPKYANLCSMKIPLPEGQYIKKIEVNDDGIDVVFDTKKKIALLFVNLNAPYWPYLKQVVEDCKTNFLPQHHVDYFVWSDMPPEDISGVTVIPTDAIEWPAPTLMRYHLFLQKEEELKNYDYVFYLDADMRVVQKISDEILGDGLTAAEHPMYALRKEYIPPYEPNEQSAAYIKRPGRVIDQDGKKRFKPYYIAGGFQGGVSKDFLEAMREMKKTIDYDFDKLNYTAIWNDESHWNKYVFDTYNGPLIVLGPEYIYPDSLIKEYYEKIWGRSYEPKIITLTKPFSLSKEGGTALNEFLGLQPMPPFECPQCKDQFTYPGHKINKVLQCPGSGKSHQLDMTKL